MGSWKWSQDPLCFDIIYKISPREGITVMKHEFSERERSDKGSFLFPRPFPLLYPNYRRQAFGELFLMRFSKLWFIKGFLLFLFSKGIWYSLP